MLYLFDIFILSLDLPYKNKLMQMKSQNFHLLVELLNAALIYSHNNLCPFWWDFNLADQKKN